MTIREIIKNLEKEKVKFQLENKRLTDELKRTSEEKKIVEEELESLKKLLKDLEDKSSLVEDVKVEVEEPQTVEVSVQLENSIDSVEQEFVLNTDEEDVPKPKRSRKKKEVEPIEEN